MISLFFTCLRIYVCVYVCLNKVGIAVFSTLCYAIYGTTAMYVPGDYLLFKRLRLFSKGARLFVAGY